MTHTHPYDEEGYASQGTTATMSERAYSLSEALLSPLADLCRLKDELVTTHPTHALADLTERKLRDVQDHLERLSRMLEDARQIAQQFGGGEDEGKVDTWRDLAAWLKPGAQVIVTRDIPQGAGATITSGMILTVKENGLNEMQAGLLLYGADENDEVFVCGPDHGNDALWNQPASVSEVM